MFDKSSGFQMGRLSGVLCQAFTVVMEGQEKMRIVVVMDGAIEVGFYEGGVR